MTLRLVRCLRTASAPLQVGYIRGRQDLASLAVRGVAAGIQLLAALVIGRLFGAEALGLTYMVWAWSRLGSDLVLLGGAQYLLMEVVKLDAMGRPDDADRSVRSFLGGAGVVGGLLAASAVLLWTFQRSLGGGTLAALATAAVVVPFLACSRLVADALRGRRRYLLGTVVEFGLAPSFLLLSAAVSSLADARSDVVLPLIVGSYVPALAIGLWLWHQTNATQAPTTREGTAHGGEGAHGSDWNVRWRLFGTNVSADILWATPFVVIPLIGVSTQAAAVFGVAQRLVAIATLVLSGLSSAYSSSFVQANLSRDRRSQRADLRRTQIIGVVCFVPILMIAFVLPKEVFRLFGVGHEHAALVLVIMALGQLVNSATGLASDLLVYSRREELELASVSIGAVVTVAAATMLGAAQGVLGLAVGYSGGLAVRHGLSFFFARRHLIGTLP